MGITSKQLGQINKILKHPEVIDVRLDKVFEGFIVGMKQQNAKATSDVHEDVVKYYRIPSFDIHINTQQNYVKMYARNEEERRSGWWSYDEDTKDMFHPHVSDYGAPCWGNVIGEIVDALDKQNYMLLIEWCLEYVRSINLDDCAGMAACRWDETDKDGWRIADGHNPTINEYWDGWEDQDALVRYSGIIVINGEEVNREDAYECDECYEWVKFEDTTYLPRSGMRICNHCAELYYETCPVCGKIIYKDEDEAVCYNDEWYCYSCAEDELFYCEGCGEWHNKDDAYEVDGCYVCEECYDDLPECSKCGKKMLEENVTGMCDDCLEIADSTDDPICVQPHQEVDGGRENSIICPVCGFVYRPEDMIEYNGIRICATCYERR